MRILAIQESDWIERGPHQTHHLLERLSQRGHSVRVIDFQNRWADQSQGGMFSNRRVYHDVHKVLENGPVTVVRPAFLRVGFLDYASILLTHAREIHREMSEFRPDVVAGFGLVNAFTGIWTARKFQIPFVYYLIDELDRLVPESILRGLAKVLEESNLRRASLVLCINKALLEQAIRMGANQERSKVLPAGIDTDRRAPQDGQRVRDRYRFGPSDLVLFFMGWMYPFSGLEEVAEEIAAQHNGPVMPKLLAVGKGELFEGLRRFARERGVEDRIVILPWQSYGEIPEFLAASDICILPAQNVEVMRNIVPIKIYEYMAAGKPVIATRLHGLLEEFPQGSGVVYVAQPRDTVAKALELSREGRMNQLGRMAQSLVAQHDWTNVADQFESMLEGLIEDARAKTFSGRQPSA